MSDFNEGGFDEDVARIIAERRNPRKSEYTICSFKVPQRIKLLYDEYDVTLDFVKGWRSPPLLECPLTEKQIEMIGEHYLTRLGPWVDGD